MQKQGEPQALWLLHVAGKGSCQDPGVGQGGHSTEEEEGEEEEEEEGAQKERKEEGGEEYALSTSARPWAKECSFNPANISPRWVLEPPPNRKVRPSQHL